MAQAIIGAIAASAAGSALGAGIHAGAEAALQAQRYQQDLTLQQNSFNHDKEMLGYQVEMSNKLSAKNLNTRYSLLQAGGLSPSDALWLWPGPLSLGWLIGVESVLRHLNHLPPH